VKQKQSGIVQGADYEEDKNEDESNMQQRFDFLT